MSESPRFDQDLLVRLRRLGAFDVSPDGRVLVGTVDEVSEDGKKYVTNLYRLDLRQPGAEPVPLTRNTRRKGQPRFAPDGTLRFLAQPDPARVAGRRDSEEEAHRKEAERLAKEVVAATPEVKEEEAPMQVHRLALDGSEPECLTDFPAGVSSFRVTAGGRLVMLVPVDPEARDLEHDRELYRKWKDRKSTGVLFESHPLRYWDHFIGPRHPRLVVAEADGGGARDLTPGQRLGLEEADWDVSRDGRKACLDFRTMDAELRFDRNLFLVDLESGQRRQLTHGTAQHWGARFSPDGRRVACVVHPEQMRVTGKRDVMVLELDGGAGKVVTADQDLWPEPPAWIDDTRLAWSADCRGAHAVHVTDLRSGTHAKLTDAGHATDLHASPDASTLYFLLDRIEAPAEVHALRIAERKPARLTSVNADRLRDVPLARGTSTTVVGADGATVQLWEIRPPGFDERVKHPLLLWIHGGPLGSFLDQFHFRWNPQVYAAAGYVLVLVNPRGSTGFGQPFIQDNNGNWGDRCYRDLMAVVDAYEKKPYVDPARMAALGASFGGYMVNWIAGRTDRFKCLVSHAGLFDLPGFWGTTDCGPEWELEFGGPPFRNPELYEQWSPHHHVEGLKTPTLVIHGELDYRVPLGEGLQMFQALQKKGVPSKFLYFPDENHWILKPANMQLWNQTVLDWLDEHLAP